MSTSQQEVLTRNVERALQKGRLDDAALILGRLKKLDPIGLKTRALELDLLEREGRLAEADALARQLLRLHPGSARVHHIAGRTALRMRRSREAVEHLRESRRLADHWRTRLWLAKALAATGELAEAEALLVSIVNAHPECTSDLAFLAERRGAADEAIALLQGHLERYPDDRKAKSQLTRLRAGALAPEELVEDMDRLQALGEEVAPEALGEYVQRLIEKGRGEEARTLVRARLPGMEPWLARRVAWHVYKAHEHDLAVDLFLASLEGHTSDPIHLNSLQRAARLAGRTADVIAAYDRLAPREPHLHGRIRKLRNTA